MDLLRSGAGSSITWLNSRFGWGADVIYSFFLLNKVKRKLRIRGGIYLRTREDSGLCTGKKKKGFPFVESASREAVFQSFEPNKCIANNK